MTVPESAARECGAARARHRWHRKAAATPAGPQRTPALLCKTRVTSKKKKTQWFLIPVIKCGDRSRHFVEFIFFPTERKNVGLKWIKANHIRYLKTM